MNTRTITIMTMITTTTIMITTIPNIMSTPRTA